MLMKLKRMLKILSCLFVRIAHFAEHVTCDEVPHIEDVDEED